MQLVLVFKSVLLDEEGGGLLPAMISASRRTMRVVRENFVLAVGYNVLAVPLAMAGKVTPLLAALAMSTSSLLVIANSLRLALVMRGREGGQ